MSKNLKKVVLASAMVAGFASAAFAHDKGPTVTLGGMIDTQLGVDGQKKAFRQSLDANGALTGNQTESFSLVNDTKIHVKADGHTHGLKYGGKVVLNADTSVSKEGEGTTAHQVMTYVDTSFGRMEAGAYTGVYEAMKVDAGSVARATGGINGDHQYWINRPVVAGGAPALSKVKFNTGSLPTASDNSFVANANKVSYFTPMFSGFRAAVSFTPDTEKHGTVTQAKTISKDVTATATDSLNSGYRNAFQGSLGYTGKWDKFGVKAALSGEFGKAKNTATHKRENLSAMELGLRVNYMGFSVAGSYGNTFKSGLFKNVIASGVAVTGAKKSNHYFTLGGSYEHASWGVSVTYLNGKNSGLAFASPAYSTQKAKSQVLSIGADYKLAPGFMPYAEINFFNYKNPTLAAGNQKNDGSLFLAGTKLSF